MRIYHPEALRHHASASSGLLTQKYVEDKAERGRVPDGLVDVHSALLLVHPRRDGADVRVGKHAHPDHLPGTTRADART